MSAKKSSRKTSKARSTTSNAQSAAKMSSSVSVAQPAAKASSTASAVVAAAKTKPTVRKENVRRFAVRRERGWALASCLVIVILFNIFGLYVLLTDIIRATSLHDPYFQYWRLIVAMLLEAIIIVSAIGMLNWKKWGFYTYIIVGCSSIIFNLSLGQTFGLAALYALLPIAVIARLIFSKNRWKMFE